MNCHYPFRKLFDFDTRKLDIDNVIDMIGFGVRRHLLKMSDSSIPAAREHARKYRNIDVASKVVLIAMITAAVAEIARDELKNVEFSGIMGNIQIE